MNKSYQHRIRLARGFTLLELLLVLVLVLLLAGAMVFNFSNLDQGTALEEGAARLDSLIRFAQAHAANTGRRVQLAFPLDDTGDAASWVGKVRIEWEPDPLGQPGVFEELQEAKVQAEAVNELVQIQEVNLPGTSTNAVGADGLPAESNNLPAEPPSPMGLDEAMGDFFLPITFNPDGSTDSMEIVLVPRERQFEQRAQHAILRLEGITGSVSHEIISEPEEDDFEFWWDNTPSKPTSGFGNPGSKSTGKSASSGLTSPSGYGAGAR